MNERVSCVWFNGVSVCDFQNDRSGFPNSRSSAVYSTSIRDVLRLDVLRESLRIIQHAQQEPVSLCLLQAVILRDGCLGPEVRLYGLAVGTELVRVCLHGQNMFPAHPGY